MITASEIISIKAKVKAEMQRRSGTGSMTAYAGTSWDFTTRPTSGGKILTEQGHKVIAPLIAVKPQGNLADAAQGTKVPSDFNTTKLNSIVNAYAAEATTTSSSSCQSSCSGLCTTGCYSGCTSCTGCSGSCTNSCSQGCNSNCSGTCEGCSGTCKGCSGCGSSCSDSCSNGCEGGCEGGCGSSCKEFCATSCRGTDD